MRIWFIFLGLLWVGILSAQSTKEVIQLSGIVISGGDSIQPLPYVNIGVKNTSRGTSSNFEGFFSMPIYQTDTLIFSTIGYQKAQVIISKNKTAADYAIIQTLQKDTIRLPETVIYPWPSVKAFKRAFLELDLPDDKITIARQNVTPKIIQELGTTLPLDSKEAASAYFRAESKKLMHMGQTPPNNLMNPFAWIEFFRMLKKGELKIEK